VVVPASVSIPATAHRVAHRQPPAHVADTAVIGCPTVPGQTCTVLFSMLRGRAVASALFSNGDYANKMGDVTIDFASSPPASGPAVRGESFLCVVEIPGPQSHCVRDRPAPKVLVIGP
jgi:hypothetical protein